MMGTRRPKPRRTTPALKKEYSGETRYFCFKVRRPVADLTCSGSATGGVKVRRPAADLRKMGLGALPGSDFLFEMDFAVMSAAQRQTLQHRAAQPEGLRSAAQRRTLGLWAWGPCQETI